MAKWIFAIVCYIGAAIQVLGLIAVGKVSKLSIRRHSAVSGRIVERPPLLLRKNPVYSNDIYRLAGSSPSPGSRYPSLGSSSPPPDIPRPKPTAKGITILPVPRVISPLRLRARRRLSAISSPGSMSGSWEDYGLSS